jgi:hypothetical protein
MSGVMTSGAMPNFGVVGGLDSKYFANNKHPCLPTQVIGLVSGVGLNIMTLMFVNLPVSFSDLTLY